MRRQTTPASLLDRFSVTPVLLIVICLAWLLAPTGANAAAPAGDSCILLLKTYPVGLPIPDAIDRGIVDALSQNDFSVVKLYVENLDLTRNPGSGHRVKLARLLSDKFAHRNIGVVMVEGAPAMNFLLTEAGGLFPDAAIISLIVPDIAPLRADPRRVMDIPWQVDPAGTLKAALNLFPQTKSVFVVTGAREGPLPFLEQAKKAFRPWEDRLKFQYSNRMTHRQMIERVAQLPPDSIVIYSPFFTDAAGRSFAPIEVVGQVCRAARVPVFATLSYFLGQGIVGGSLLQTEMIGRKAGRLAVDYLTGRLKLTEPTTVFDLPTKPMFDGAQIVRWGVEFDKLPPDSLVINRPGSLWADYRGQTTAALVLLALQTATILGLIVMTRRRKLAERERMKAENRFRKIVDTANEGIIMTDPDQRITFVNDKLARMLGYRPEEMVGQGFQTLIHPDDRDRLEAIVAERRKGRESSYECRYRRRDEATVWFLTNAAPLLDQVGNYTGSFAMLTDITERKRAEEELVRINQVVAGMPVGLHLYRLDKLDDDRTLRLVATNPAADDITGQAPESAMGRTMDRIFPNLRERDVPRICASVIASGGMHDFGDVPGLAVDKIHRLQIISLPGGYGALLFEDITPQRQAEAQLRQAQKMEAVGILAGGIAHEFNNILGAVLGYADLISRDVAADQVTAKDAKYARAIITAAERAKKLIKQIMTFSRKMDPQLRPMDLNQEVERSLELLEHTTPKMVAVERRLAPDLPLVMADPDQIGQVVINLANNAFQAMPDGGVLTVGSEKVTLKDQTCPTCGQVVSGDWVRLTMSDTGRGMSPEELPKIFDPFYTTKDVGQGTGLGLSMIHGILLNHRAHISCDSQPGRGTTFTVYLPISRPTADRDDPAESRPRAAGAGEIILLVEDEEDLRELGRTILTRGGYEVLVARSGEQALEIHSREGVRIDLVVLDINMPGMGGRKCYRELVRLDPEVKVIIASGYALEGELKDRLEAGLIGYTPKPYTMNEILTAVRRRLDGQPPVG